MISIERIELPTYDDKAVEYLVGLIQKTWLHLFGVCVTTFSKPNVETYRFENIYNQRKNCSVSFLQTSYSQI